MADEYVTIRIRTFAAEGISYEDGSVGARDCGLCHKGIDLGAGWFGGEVRAPARVVLSKLWGTVHAQCFVDAIEGQNGAGAWTALAYQVAHRPSHYRASDIRAVIHNLLIVLNRHGRHTPLVPQEDTI